MAIENIIRIYSEVCGCSMEELIGSTHKREVADIRQSIWYVLYTHDYSYTSIAQAFRRKSHSTIINGINKVKGLEEVNDREIISILEKIRFADSGLQEKCRKLIC